MTDYSWKKDESGDWSDAKDWTGGVPNGSTADVTIAAAGSYSVTIASGESFTVRTLTLDDANAALFILGALNLAGTMTLTAGSVDLNGTVAGGTIIDPNGALYASTGTLDGVGYEGTLDLDDGAGQLYIEGNVSMTGADGTGNGSIIETRYGASLLASASATLDGATIEIGNDSTADILGVADTAGAGVVLTLGAATKVLQTEPYATLSSGASTGDGIVNLGTIDAGYAGGIFTISGNSFANQGTFTLGAGDTLDLTVASFTNSGSITITDATLYLDVADFSSSGSFMITPGSVAYLQTDPSLAELQEIDAPSAKVVIESTLDEKGGVLDVGTGTELGTLILSGTIEDGTVDDAGYGINSAGGTFDAVTIQGTITLGDNVLTIVNGLSGLGKGDSADGVIAFDGANPTLIAQGKEAFNHLVIDASGGVEVELTGTAPVLTLGNLVRTIASGTSGLIFGGEGADAGELINDGSMMVDQRGDLGIETQVFINSGALSMTSGQFLIEAGTFKNTGTFMASGGKVILDTNTFSSIGSFTLTGSASMIIEGDITLAELASITVVPGSVELSGTVDLDGGTLAVGTGSALGKVKLSGTIEDGTLQNVGAGISSLGGTLSDMTLGGTLFIPGDGCTLNIADGLIGAGPGSPLDINGQSVNLELPGTETLSDLTLDVSGNDFDLDTNTGSTTAATITLAANDVLDFSYASAASLYSSQVGDKLINDGEMIFQNPTGDGYSIDESNLANVGIIKIKAGLDIGDGAEYSRFTNSGTIALSDPLNGQCTIDVADFSNSGKIEIESGTEMEILTDNFSDTGRITLASGTSLVLIAKVSTAELAEIQAPAARIDLEGVLDNTDQVLHVGSGSSIGAFSFFGTIEGGVISDPTGIATFFRGNLFQGVTYQGPLDGLEAGSSLSISGGFTLTGAGGTGAGVINDQFGSNQIYVTDDETLNDLTINVGAGVGDFLGIDDIAKAGVTLTLGSNATIDLDGFGGAATLVLGSVNDAAGDTIINEGTISDTFSGGTLTIDVPVFTNLGTIDVDSGSLLTLQPVDFTNLAETTLKSGIYEVGDGTIVLSPNGTITTDDATIILGTESTIESEDTTTSAEIIIDTTLKTIGAQGVLQLLADRSWTGALPFTNAGSLVLGGGTFSEAKLTNESGGAITGFGTIAPKLVNDGTITASGGMLVLEKPVSGTGAFDIDAGASIAFDSAASSTQTVTFESGSATSTLGIADSPGFAATVAGFGAADTIDSSAFQYSTAETLSFTPNDGDTGGVLTLTHGSLSASITLFGQYVASGFGFAADGGSGVDITYTPPASEHPKLAAHG